MLRGMRHGSTAAEQQRQQQHPRRRQQHSRAALVTARQQPPGGRPHLKQTATEKSGLPRPCCIAMAVVTEEHREEWEEGMPPLSKNAPRSHTCTRGGGGGAGTGAGAHVKTPVAGSPRRIMPAFLVQLSSAQRSKQGAGSPAGLASAWRPARPAPRCPALQCAAQPSRARTHPRLVALGEDFEELRREPAAEANHKNVV